MTPQTYPFKPYPPFKDPDDWRTVKATTDMSPSFGPKARALTSDALADHDGKHTRHDHPWCAKCCIRFGDAERVAAGSLKNKTPAQCHTQLIEDLRQPVTREHIDAAIRTLDQGIDFPAHIAKRDNLTADTITALESYASDLDDWNFSAEEARTETSERVLRYLVLHGRQPSDTYDPEIVEPTSLADELLDGDQLDELPEPEPLIDGVLARHSYMILRGRDHTYKSFTALDWALCLATGKPWQGKPSRHVRVLYVAGEGAFGLAARKRAWEAAWGYDVNPAMFTVLPRGLNLHTAAELDDLLAIVEQGLYALVILDTLRRVSGRADGNSSEMGIVVDNIDKVKRATASGSVLVLTHTDKGDNDSRGFSGIEDDADIVWHNKFDDGRVRIKNTKMKDGPDGAEFVLKPSPVLDSVVLSAVADNLGNEDNTASQRAILFVLAEVFGQTDGASASELIEATQLPKSTFYLARAALLKTRQIESNGPPSRRRYSLPESNRVQQPTPPLSRDFPTSPTESKSKGPVQSSPAPLIGLDVGLQTLDNRSRTA